MQKKVGQGQGYYFPDKLREQLSQMAQHPLTVIEAPSGFGKTTAVREYLNENLPATARQFWYTSLGEPASAAWKNICELFSHLDVDTAAILQDLKMPTQDTLFHMSSHLQNIRCEQETYLILDNFHLVDCDIPWELMGFLSLHGNPNLHIVFITQQLEHRQKISLHNNNIYTINASSFFFSRKDTAKLFRREGIRLSDEELESIYMSTEGWVAAIRLQLVNYLETNSLAPAADIEQLVEGAIWNRLSEEEQDFLLSVSVFESFTVRQAAVMQGVAVLPEKIETLLKNNDFIRYLPEKQVYNIHGILQDYLQNRFHHYLAAEHRKDIFRRAGDACAAEGKYCTAAEFYYKVQDFAAILSLPFTARYFNERREKYNLQFCAQLVNRCPEEILGKYPRTLLSLAYLTYSNGYLNEYQKLCRILSQIIKEQGDCGDGEGEKIKGEYALLTSLGDYNDLAKMREKQQRAWEILRGPSTIMQRDTPYLFATPSILAVLWRHVGQLGDVLAQMEEEKSIYRQLTGYNGAGACHVLKAEAMLMQGKDEEAAILCHKALYEARSHGQIGISICAQLVLARLSILRGDVEAYSKARKNIEVCGRESPSLYVFRQAEHSLSYLSLLLGVQDKVAPYFYDMGRLKEKLYAPIVPLAQTLHLKLLLLEGRLHEFYGICRLLLEEYSTAWGNIVYLMPRLHQLLLLARTERIRGRALAGQDHLKEALALALPDGIYLPLAEYEGMAEFLAELPLSAFAVAGQDGPPLEAEKTLDKLLSLCQRWQRGLEKIKTALIQGKSPLTPREREIALLAKKRLTGKEIAAKLYISEHTVRTTLRNVYSKLNINSKFELASLNF
ncbi:MAG: helix-turn-helix transcriptional regulator [Firmicutes bacterium]|nr:helix-turn-helix transcriptional regulator [Bacillota bacterium]